MSSSSLSLSSASTVCSCSGKLCFCELVSPMTPPSSSKKTPVATAETTKPSYLVPGCFCFRCELIRDGFDDDRESNFEGEFADDVTIIDPADIFGIDFENDEINEVAKNIENDFPMVVDAEKAIEELQFLVTSLC